MKRIKENQRLSDQEYEEVADTMSGMLLLRVTSAVFVGMIDDLVACRLHLKFRGSPDYGVIEMRARKIAESVRITKELIQSEALAEHPFAQIPRNSEAAKKWFREWAEVLLHTLGRTLYMARNASEPGRWRELRLRLSFKHSSGAITSLRGIVKGS